MANTIKLGNGNWATKEGSLLAYNDENNNFKPLPFTTTRASSASVVNKQGLIETVGSGIPRIDFSDDTKGALLLEPSSTNLVTYSEDFSNVSWTKLGNGTGTTAVITPNYAISPDGSLNATRLQCLLNGGTTTSDQSLIYDLDSSGTSQSISVYMKSNNGSNQVIFFANTVSANDTFTVTSEWQRFEFNHATSNHTFSLGLRGATGSDDNADISIWGAQSESLSYATSYIKTIGTTQTRVADNASLLNLDTNNLVTDSGSWTVLFEIELLSNESAMDKIRLTDASGSPRAYLYHSSMGVAGTDWTGGTSIPMNTNNKLIYRANSTQSITAFNNGVNISTMTSTSTPIVFNRILFYGSNGAFKIKQMQVFNTTLSDTECINLTTI